MHGGNTWGMSMKYDQTGTVVDRFMVGPVEFQIVHRVKKDQTENLRLEWTLSRAQNRHWQSLAIEFQDKTLCKAAAIKVLQGLEFDGMIKIRLNKMHRDADKHA